MCLVFFFAETVGLRDVILTIEPAIVERLHHSILRCQYDLQNEPLYAVKWYRGGHEFYRYTPNEHPSTKVFPVGGISVDVSIKHLYLNRNITIKREILLYLLYYFEL